MNHQALSSFIWSVADLLRGDYKQSEYGRVILPFTSLRDTENVPLGEDVKAYFKREVLPHVPDVWIDHEKTKVGYEIPFNRHFYVFEPPRDLEEIDRDLAEVSGNIMKMLRELGV